MRRGERQETMDNKVHDQKPPRFAEWLIKQVSRYEDRDAILDNLREEFANRLSTQGKLLARWWYWLHGLRSVLPFMSFELKWRIVMFKNYMKIALRNFYKHKSFSFINISGLAIGMACCMLIMLWVQDELNYEKFNKNIDSIFFVANYLENEPNSYSSSVPAPLIPYLKDKYAEIRHSSRFRHSGRRLFSYNGNNVFEDNGGFADPELFDIFSFKAVLNDPKAALMDVNTIILTKSMAERYFGSEDPLGKTIKLENQYLFSVGAIIEDIPRSSSIRFDYLIPFENFGRFDQVRMDNWGRHEGYMGFVILYDSVDHEVFSEKIVNEIVNNIPESSFRLKLSHYKNLRLFGLNNNGTFKFVLVFSAIAILMLLIACINFVNLTTAQAGKRAREIGMRKVIGASKSSIRKQIYSELFVIVTIAFILAVILVDLFLPKLNTLSGKTLTFSITENFGLLVSMLSIAFVTMIISGTYPAFYLSSFSPVTVMKSATSTGSSKSSLRKLLVIAQFAISIILIISTIIITRQMIYVKNRELGFDKDHLVYVELLGNLKTRFDTVKNELLKNPNINCVTTAQSLPNNTTNFAGGLDWEGRPADVRGGMNFISVEKDYFKTVGIEFIEGETFKTIPDNMLLREFIINEKATELMKIENPVGKSFKMWDRDPGRIIGIVKNIHNVSLHQEIRPAFYVQFPYFYNYLIINMNNENIQNTVGFIQDVYRKINPNYPFEFHFLNENIDQFYQTERQINSVIKYFTMLAIFISCLGLFGLSLFMAEQRTKEIGIRKTLGATVSNIVGLMSKDFLLLVAVSNLISWPVAYFIMNKWIQNFVYRIDIRLWIFALAAALALFIAFLTISFQTIKAASANPVDSLRYE
jgi:ABC-type antimicrobial peptide transport system permease subunit